MQTRNKKKKEGKTKIEKNKN